MDNPENAEDQETERELINLLEFYDPFYMYSDDHKVWLLGEKVSQRISLLITKLEEGHGLGLYHEILNRRYPGRNL